MAETDKKKLKLNVKNTQIAEALQLGKLKEKLAKKKLKAEEEESKDKASVSPTEDEAAIQKRKARAKSAFSEKKEEDEVEAVSPDQPVQPKVKARSAPRTSTTPPPRVMPVRPVREVLGPTGRHINDILPPKPIKKPAPEKPKEKEQSEKTASQTTDKTKAKEFTSTKTPQKKFKEFKDLRTAKKPYTPSRFDSRDRQGLRDSDDGRAWRKRRSKQQKGSSEDTTIRPNELSIRLPTSVKDLASDMKLKASQLISKLFLQGEVLTINDLLTDETTVQFLGEEFGCTITIDTSEEERIRITDQTIQEEIAETDPTQLKRRAPAVAFMGHVDHGKTSLIDYIRKSNVAAGEAGAITQHIGAFLCKTDVGDIAILDTPGHEAFSEMRARGAEVTDIVVLVVAGDEGLKAQTIEAINHAKAAGVTIVVAINKCDKPNFNPDEVYRQLSEQELLPEQWGGQTITVNCSAVTGQGISSLVEMLALQSEILELKANSSARARGTVIESERQKGMGSVATLFVQNGTLHPNDALVFEEEWGRVKTMKNEQGQDLKEAGPSTPVEVTGLSGLPKAGQEFIVVSSEKEARQISQARKLEHRDKHLQQSRKMSLENLLQEAGDTERKILKIILRADMQGSLEALKAALLKIESEKAKVEIISTGIGEVSESDVLLASASKAIIVGFHTQVESHADELVKLHNVVVSLHNVIYHVVDEIRAMMAGLLDKLPQENETGKAEVREIFKSSQLGLIAGCIITDGTIHRNDYARLIRDGKEIWKGSIASLKRFKEDVKEVGKGIECGILLSKFSDYQAGDLIEAYTISYIDQEL